MKYYLLFYSFLSVGLVQAQSAHEPLRAGDRQYERQNFEEAGKGYKDALRVDPNNPQAAYNLGNSLYQQGKYEDAAKQFEQAAPAVKTPQDKADLLHNLGNAYLKQKKYKEAIDSYVNSLRLRPGDPQTKMNLQMAKKKNLEQQQQQQNQQQPQNQDQPQNQNQEKPQDQEKQPNQPPKQEDQPNKNQPQNPPQEQPKETTPPGKMSPEEAKRLLETAVGPDDKKNARKYREQAPDTKPKSNKKDW